MRTDSSLLAEIELIIGAGYGRAQDGSYYVAVEDANPDDDRSAADALDDAYGDVSGRLLALGCDIEWTGSANTGSDGVSTSDIAISPSDLP